MKKTWKNISTYVLVALVSIGATYGMYTYLDKNNNNSSYSPHGHGQTFKQEASLHLASITSQGFPDFTNVAESSVHAVVHIKSTSTVQGGNRRQAPADIFDYFFGPGDRGGQYGQPQPRVGFGSGVIISADGYIVTNNHVIDNATEIEVTLNDNSKYKAKLIGTDAQTDIALLKIEGDKFDYISFGDSDSLKVGEWVLAVGNPFNLTSTVTAGIVSAKGRGNISRGQGSIQSFIQTDAAINQGNSGGALVNTKGELVGINTAIYSQTGDFAGYGFAVPISIAAKVVADIKEYGQVQRAMLGVLMLDLANQKELEPEKTKHIKINHGAYISEFAEQSPAKKAGMLEGDIITAVNGAKIRGAAGLQEEISRYRPGDKVKVTVNRNNKDVDVTITLENSEGTTAIVKSTDGISIVGAAFKELSKEDLKTYGISSGVEVAGVDRDGEFHKEGITKGFVIQQINNARVSTVDQVESIIKSAAKGEDKVLFIAGFYKSTGSKKYYAIDLNNEK